MIIACQHYVIVPNKKDKIWFLAASDFECNRQERIEILPFTRKTLVTFVNTYELTLLLIFRSIELK